MTRKRHTEELIIAVLQELCRKHGISDVTIYHWRAKYAGLEDPLPETLILDNGSGIRDDGFRRYAAEHRAHLHFIQPGKPVQNAFIESFNGKLRDECKRALVSHAAGSAPHDGSLAAEYTKELTDTTNGDVRPEEFIDSYQNEIHPTEKFTSSALV